MPCAVPRCNTSGQSSFVQFPRSHFLYERWRSAIELGTGETLPNKPNPQKAEICQQHFELTAAECDYMEPVMFLNHRTGQTVHLSSCRLCLKFHPVDTFIRTATVESKIGIAPLEEILKVGFGVQLSCSEGFGGICEGCLVRLDMYLEMRKHFSLASKSCKKIKLLIQDAGSLQFRKINKTEPDVVAIRWEIVEQENSTAEKPSDSQEKPNLEIDMYQTESSKTNEPIEKVRKLPKKRKYKPKTPPFKEPKDPTAIKRPRMCLKNRVKVNLKKLSDQKCYICTQLFETRELLFQHMLEHVGCTMHCDMCNESFPNITRYNRHLAKHDETERPRKCAFCELRFQHTPALRRHENLIHNVHQQMKLPKYDPLNPGKMYACQHCGKLCKSTSGLLEHEDTHAGIKRFQCKTCGRPFPTKTNLERHLLIHTDEKPFKCEICGRGFRQSPLLKDHLRLHTGETPFACSTCQLSFSTTDRLRRHQINVHGMARVARKKPVATVVQPHPQIVDNDGMG